MVVEGAVVSKRRWPWNARQLPGPIIRSYKGAVAPASYSTMSGVKCTDLLSEYSAKERVISPTFLVLKVPFEVPHDCGAARFNVGMYF